MKTYKDPEVARRTYSRVYENMRGADGADGTDRTRFSCLENMYRDYDGETPSATESVPGYRAVRFFGQTIHALTRSPDDGNDGLTVHAGTGVYRVRMAEGAATPTACNLLGTMADSESVGFVHGTSVYFLDGDGLYVTDGTSLSRVQSGGGTEPYIPTVYKNGKRYEQRNLLTRKFREEYTVTDPAAVSYGTPDLAYGDNPDRPGEVLVTGLGTAVRTDIFIPSTVLRGGTRVPVGGIAAGAFEGEDTLVGVHIASGIRYIGKNAFKGCTSLTGVLMQDTVETIDSGAFAGCTALIDFHIGAGVRNIATDAFSGCSSLTTVTYALDEVHLGAIEGITALSVKSFSIRQTRRGTRVCCPVYTKTLALSSTTVNGMVRQCSTAQKGGFVTGVIFDVNDMLTLYDTVVTVTGTMPENFTPEDDAGTSFFRMTTAATGTAAAQAIEKCRVAALHNGHVFLSGNPAYPGKVFYSSADGTGKENPTYFGDLCYFTDGGGQSDVRAMVSALDRLIVFKERDDGDGGIFLHREQKTAGALCPVTYPVDYAVTGYGADGGAAVYRGDPVFLDDGQVMAVERGGYGTEYRVVSRSHTSGTILSDKDLSSACLAEWNGYLAVTVGTDIFLGDARQAYRHAEGHTAYEWYRLCGVGAYVGWQYVYRYASEAAGGLSVSPKAGDVVSGSVAYFTAADGNSYGYTEEDGRKYAVIQSTQHKGGTVRPVTAAIGVGKRLFFGTTNGACFVFNNDLYGLCSHYRTDADYTRAHKKRLHPFFYRFDSHAPRYVLRTAADDGGMPYLEKNTEAGTLAVKYSGIGRADITTAVIVDGEEACPLGETVRGTFEFFDMDFSRLSFSSRDGETRICRKNKRGWMESKIELSTDAFDSPFGVQKISYRYAVKGKIKQ